MNKELIRNIEYVDRLTPEGRKDIKDYVIKLEQENKELKEQLEKKYEKVGTLTTEILYEENKELHNKIDKAIEYMKDFIFEPLLVNEDRKLIMFNGNLRVFEEILKDSDVDE